MRRITPYILVGCVMLVFPACRYQKGKLQEPLDSAQKITLRLEAGQGGGLEVCDENDVCKEHSNPARCAVLEVVIDAGNGETCETCFDHEGDVINHGCGQTSVACTVVTAPEPDCVVCAYVDHAVIFSTCIPTEPLYCEYYDENGNPTGGDPGAPPAACTADGTCAPGYVCVDSPETTTGVCLPDCKICYDAGGRKVLFQCRNDCSKVACPTIGCAPGYRGAEVPGECCPQCLPVSDCTQLVCPDDSFALMDCPPGTELVRDPADCCHNWCEAKSCPPPGDAYDKTSCPSGYVWIDAFPSCGRCELIELDPRGCTSGQECDEHETCSVNLGECRPEPRCDPNGTCSAVCYGICIPEEPSCHLSGNPEETTTLDFCEGELVAEGLDTEGCPLPPTCTCPDGIISFDGNCPETCSEVECTAAPPQCESGEHLAWHYPYCCGICLPDDGCVPGDPEGAGDLTPGLGALYGCPEVTCGVGYHLEIDSNCCDTCVRDEEICKVADDCHLGEICEADIDDCDLPPGGSDDPLCLCVPEAQCFESDRGVDPDVAGGVEGFAADGTDYGFHDECNRDRTAVIEFYCYSMFDSSTQMTHGVSVIECPSGCDRGACKPSP